MVKYLIVRPVAVFMTTLAFLLLGIVSIFKIPTSLLPDLAIPEITIQVSYPNSSAENLEQSIVRPLRNQLSQISNLKDLQSETKDGLSTILLKFNHESNIDYCFIETNEKIDAAMNFLPKELERPRVIKAAATDIPILNVSLYLKNDTSSFLELSEFTENVVKKRLEQLPEVAIADVNGLEKPEIILIPNEDKIQSLGINQQDITTVLKENNFELGNLLIQNGIYQYYFRFSNPLKSLKDIKDIYIKKNGRILQLKEICEVKLSSEKPKGLVSFGGKRAINIAIIKQPEAQISDTEASLNQTIAQFENDYPAISFKTSKDQTQLLKLSLNNLKKSLLIGVFLAVLVMFFFLEDLQSPVIIAFSIPVSLIISILLLYWFGLSINIISLSGLILGVGMMIDNSIIVIDNITLKLNQGNALLKACAKGVNEIIMPLASSVLTTCMVFIPLVFLSGISGALFYDQAMTVSIGLISSFLISIFFIPVLFYVIKKKNIRYTVRFHVTGIEKLYGLGYRYFIEKKMVTFLIVLVFLIMTPIFFYILPYEKLPALSETDTELEINWNEDVTLEENLKRVKSLNNDSEIFLAEIGEKSYTLSKEHTKSSSESSIYIRENSTSDLNKTKNRITKEIQKQYPEAIFSFSPQKNLFEYIFGADKTYITANVYSNVNKSFFTQKDLAEVEKVYNKAVSSNSTNSEIFIQVKFDNLHIYNVSYTDLVDFIKSKFNQNTIDFLRTSESFIPIKISGNANVDEILHKSFIFNKDKKPIPLSELIRVNEQEKLSALYGDRLGTKLIFNLSSVDKMEEMKKSFLDNKSFNVEYSGGFFELKNMQKELLFILIISILLLYLIMAAQFESLIFPLIILIEIPIDIGGALLFLFMLDQTINIMSIIGVIVMSGIIINDSIIKIHTINELIKEGYSIDIAIKEGGKLRLKAILMTSLTTILALVPVLFGSGIGNELQKPLAAALIGGMIIGTFVSLYFIPILYKYIYMLKK